MPTYRGLRCTVHTKDGPLEEYKFEQDEDQSDLLAGMKVVYVQAQDATNFWIVCEALPEYKFTVGNRVSFCIELDGRDMGSSCVSEACPVYTIKGAHSPAERGEEFVQLFTFSEVLLVEDQSLSIFDGESLAKMGEISITALRAKKIRNSRKQQPPKTVQSPSIEKLNEKMMKGRDLTHVTKYCSVSLLLCPKETIAARSFVDLEYLDEVREPYACFRILYRSKQTLQSLMLVPFTPSRSRSMVGSQELQEVSEEVLQEIAKLRSQIETLENKLVKVKREVTEEEDEQHGSESKRIKPSKGDTAGIIDLTIDG